MNLVIRLGVLAVFAILLGYSPNIGIVSIAYSQSLKVTEFRPDFSRTDAVQYPKEDLNGERCGLIRLGLTLPDADFEGDIIYTKYKKGEWWIYMINGANWITILSKDYTPLHYEFEGICSNVTYIMTVERSSKLESTKSYSIGDDAKDFIGEEGFQIAYIDNSGKHGFAIKFLEYRNSAIIADISIDELRILYPQRHSLGLFGEYWSSTEIKGTGNAFVHPYYYTFDFDTGTIGKRRYVGEKGAWCKILKVQRF